MHSRSKAKVQVTSFILAAVFLCCLFSSCQWTRHKTASTLNELLNDKYYDWSPSYKYSFFLDDAEWQWAEFYELPDEVLDSIAETKPQTVFLMWDVENKLVSECGAQEKDAEEFFMVRIEGYGILLIPAVEVVTIGEPMRPLAFFIVPKESKT